jgi:hypothetical protein
MLLSGMFYNIINIIAFTLLLSLLTACASQKEHAAKDFKLSLEKWQALTQFSESFLEQTPIKVITSISKNYYVDSGFKLTNFRLSLSESATEINLLKPNITSKYICNRNCVYLSELVVLKNKELDIVSNIYFEANEFELFEFYSKLYLLNTKVEKYTQVNDPLFLRYLAWLAMYNPPIDDINDFISYLEQVLDEKSFFDFVNDPKKRFVAKDNSPLDSKLWTHEDLSLSDKWTEEQIPWGNSAEEQISWESSALTTVASTKAQQAHLIDIGDVVCVGVFNQFGIVSQIIGNKIEVALRGELRVFSNGILSEDIANSILKLNGKIDFIEINKTQLFSETELVKCDVY